MLAIKGGDAAVICNESGDATSVGMPKATKPASAKMPATEPKISKKKSYLADKNQDGKTTRSEAKGAGITISAKDLNDDGRTTRAEARAARMAKLHS